MSDKEIKEVHADQIKNYHGEILDGEGVPLFYSSTDTPMRPTREAEKIRDHRETIRGLEFLVHRKGAPNSRDSWEPPPSFITVNNQEWKNYCQIHNLFCDLQNIPIGQEICPRVEPWGVSSNE